MKKQQGTHSRVSPETKKLLDKCKIYPEESYDKVIKRLAEASNTQSLNPESGEETYNQQLKRHHGYCIMGVC